MKIKKKKKFLDNEEIPPITQVNKDQLENLQNEVSPENENENQNQKVQ